MSDTPPPLSDEQLDELLSADLDGEFETAARDLGFAPEIARARLDATPGIVERRAALTAARDLLAEVPAHDELVIARLRAEATAEASAGHESDHVHRRARWLTTVGSIAAAIVLVVGVGFALRKTGGSSTKSSASSGGNAVAAPASSAPGSPNALGSAATPRALADALQRQSFSARVKGTTSLSPASSPGPQNAAADNAGNTASEVGSAKSAAPGPQACADEAKAFAVATNAPTRYGTATVAGKPVLFAVYREGRAEVVVILTPQCGLLLQQTFPLSP